MGGPIGARKPPKLETESRFSDSVDGWQLLISRAWGPCDPLEWLRAAGLWPEVLNLIFKGESVAERNRLEYLLTYPVDASLEHMGQAIP